MQYMVTPTVPYAEEANTISLQDSESLRHNYDSERENSHLSPTSYQASSTSSDSRRPVAKIALVMAATMSLNDSPPRPHNSTKTSTEEVQQQGPGAGDHLPTSPSPSPPQVTHTKWIGVRLKALKAAANATNPNPDPDPAPTSPVGSEAVSCGSGSVSSHRLHDATASPTSMFTHPASPAPSLTDIEDLFQGTVEYDVPTFAEILLTLQAGAPASPKSHQSAVSFSAGETNEDDKETSTTATGQVVTEFEAALQTYATLAEAVRLTIPLPLQDELGMQTSPATLHAVRHLLSPAQCNRIQKLWAKAKAREIRALGHETPQQVPTQAHAPTTAAQPPTSLREVRDGPLRPLSHNATVGHTAPDAMEQRSVFDAHSVLQLRREAENIEHRTRRALNFDRTDMPPRHVKALPPPRTELIAAPLQDGEMHPTELSMLTNMHSHGITAKENWLTATDPIMDQAQEVLQEIRDRPLEAQVVDQALAAVVHHPNPPPSTYDLRDSIFKRHLDMEMAIAALRALQETQPAPPISDEPSAQEWEDLMQGNLVQPPNSPMSRVTSDDVTEWLQDIDWDCWEDLPPLESKDLPSPLPTPTVPLPASPRLPACDPTHPEFNLPLGDWDLIKVTGDPLGPAAQDAVTVAMAETTKKERVTPPRPPSLTVTFQDYPPLTVPPDPDPDFHQFKSGRSPRGRGDPSGEAAEVCRNMGLGECIGELGCTEHPYPDSPPPLQAIRDIEQEVIQILDSDEEVLFTRPAAKEEDKVGQKRKTWAL